MNLSRQLGILLSVLLLSSCASLQPRLQEVQVPPDRFFLKGFSLMPLNEQGWFIIERNPDRAVLAKQGDKPDETLAIEADLLKGGSPMLNSNEEFVLLIKETEARNTDPARFKVLRHEVSPYTEKDNNCVRSHMVAEDHTAVKRSGKAGQMILEKLTLICVHPKDNRVGVSVAYSQRYYPDQRDPGFIEKATSILNSIEFTDL
ncbi:MAG TPA: hypothetical protein VLU73_15010 [Methylococcaceae bacterium]|nr:hypothetical protein [Methylococcaceae bacterium]